MSPNELAKRRQAGLRPPCAEVSQNPQTITVHLSEGETWVLPWSRFCHARFVGETLILVFLDVEISLSGQKLAEIAKKVGTLSVEALRTLPTEYRPIIPATEPFVTELEVLPRD